jgi:hypothetical protein
MIAAAIKSLADNREEYVRSQPGKQKGYDIKLPTPTKGGLDFEINIPYVYTDASGKVAEYSANTVEKVEVNEEEKFADFM